eukprot:3094956-Rhodomonas_salina.1
MPTLSVSPSPAPLTSGTPSSPCPVPGAVRGQSRGGAAEWRWEAEWRGQNAPPCPSSSPCPPPDRAA